MIGYDRNAHLSDADLLAWNDGVLDFAEHIEECKICQERALALQAEDRRLKTTLFRAACPPTQLLAEFGAGFLVGDEQKYVAQHVSSCPHCRQELSWQQAFMQSLTPAPAPAVETETLRQRLEEVREGVRVIVARWVNNVTTGPNLGRSFQFAMGTMRGEHQRPMLFDANELQVTLEFYRDPEHPGKHQIIGLLIGDETPESFRVQVWQEKTCIAETMVDELGNFVLGNLSPANYDLKLIHPKLEIQLNSLEV